jgi:hypothetical protein
MGQRIPFAHFPSSQFPISSFPTNSSFHLLQFIFLRTAFLPYAVVLPRFMRGRWEEASLGPSYFFCFYYFLEYVLLWTPGGKALFINEQYVRNWREKCGGFFFNE